VARGARVEGGLLLLRHVRGHVSSRRSSGERSGGDGLAPPLDVLSASGLGSEGQTEADLTRSALRAAAAGTGAAHVLRDARRRPLGRRSAETVRRPSVASGASECAGIRTRRDAAAWGTLPEGEDASRARRTARRRPRDWRAAAGPRRAADLGHIRSEETPETRRADPAHIAATRPAGFEARRMSGPAHGGRLAAEDRANWRFRKRRLHTENGREQRGADQYAAPQRRDDASTGVLDFHDSPPRGRSRSPRAVSSVRRVGGDLERGRLKP